MPGARGERDIDIGPKGRTFAAGFDAARIQGVVAFLMQGDSQNIRIIYENRLGSIAMMDIPIDDSKAGGVSFGAGGLNRDRQVVEQAEPIGPIRQCVMPRRARQRIGIAGLPR